jgi:hypothetical protein
MNPYEPSSLESKYAPPKLVVWVHSIASIFSLGTIVGVSVLFCVSAIFILPFWGPPDYKGDKRWETIVLLASPGLPLAILSGILVVGAGFPFVKKPLTIGQMLFCWFMSIALIPSFKPVVDRIRRRGNTPAYEWVPDTLWYIALGFLITTLVVAAAKSWGPSKKVETSKQ